MTRQEFDNYPTMRELTWALVDRLPELDPLSTIVEPCAGGLDIVQAITAKLPDTVYITNDIHPGCACAYTSDAADRDAAVWQQVRALGDRHAGKPEWTITNPPFKLAHKILPLALEHSAVGVAFLLRLSYLEPTMKRQARGAWLRAHEDQMVRLIPFGNPRPWFPPYAKDETDSVTPAWFVWLKEWSWRAHGIQSPIQFVNDWLKVQE